MTVLHEVLRAQEGIQEEREHHARQGYKEGRFEGYLPNSRLCEFRLEQTGELLQYRNAQGMPNLNGLLGMKWFIITRSGEITEMSGSIELQLLADPGPPTPPTPGIGRRQRP